MKSLTKCFSKYKKSNKGVTTVFGTLLFMIVAIAIASILFIALFQYNNIIQQTTVREDERAQERIVFSNVTLSGNNVVGANITNIGSEQVQIKGFYRNSTFICDPSDTALNIDGAYLDSQESRIINMQSILFNPNDCLTVATARGVKSVQLVANLFPAEISYQTVDTNYGPLRLNFTQFFYETTNKNGNPTGTWMPGAIIPSSVTYCAWNITVTNIDTRAITINQYSSLDLVPNEPGAQTPWYLKNTSQTISANQTVNIIYVWDGPQGSFAQKFGAFTTAKVFMTFYGSFSDGLSYGQTIPFEAIHIQ
jgi:hypothetical protein